MQIGKDTTIRLMIVDDSGEDAEAVVSAFRNGGIAIRPHRPLNAAELAGTLADIGRRYNIAVQSNDIESTQETSLRLYEMARAVVADRKSKPLDTSMDATSALLAARVDLGARAALAARLRGDAGLAVDRLGEDAGECRLAGAARTREQVRVVQALGVEGVDERRDDVRLSDDLLEHPGTPLAGEDLIGHRSENIWRG